MNGERPTVSRSVDPLARCASWGLAGVLLVALTLRLWGITFGLPYVEHPDEPFWVSTILKMIKSGDPNPHDFIYPSFYYYLNAFAYLAYYAIGRLFGVFHGLADLVEPVLLIGGSGKTTLPALFLIGRSISVALGAGTAALTYDVGRRFTGFVLGGVLAGLLAAVSPVLVANNRYLIPDGAVAFFTTLALWAAWGIFERGRTRDYLLAGLAVGLAVGTKYNAAPFILAIILAHFLRGSRRGLRDWRLYAALALSGAAFLVTTPYALLDFRTFMNGAFIDVRHYTGGHAGNTGNSLLWYLDYFWRTEGPVLALAAAGILWGIHKESGHLLRFGAERPERSGGVVPATQSNALRAERSPGEVVSFDRTLSDLLYRRARGTILLAVTTLVYLLFIGVFAVHAMRTALPLIPLFALLAASWTSSFAPAAGVERAPIHLAAVATLVAITLAFPLAGTVRDTVRLTTPDSLDTAREWIEANIPAGAHIGVESYAPWIDPQKYVIQGFYKLNDHPPEWYVSEGYDYLVFSQAMFRRFYADPAEFAAEIAHYEVLFSAFAETRVFTDGGYEVRVYRVPRP